MRLALALVLCAAAAASAESRPHAPLALAIVIDRSGSMQGAKLESAKAGAKAAIASLAPGDRVAVIVFDSEASVIVETTPVGRDTRKLDAAIDAIVAGGGTTFVPALDAAAAQLHGQPGHHHVIFLTDGEGPTDGLDDQLARLRADAATMSAIGVGDADLAQLTYMVDRISAPPGGAARSGSRVYFATGERDLEKMIAADAKAAIEASRTSLQRPDRR